MEDNIGNAGLQWVDDSYDAPIAPTEMPILGSDGTTIGMLVIIIVAALFTIVLLFVIAIFIDCRHQKIINRKTQQARRVLRLKLPTLGRVREDEEHFADKMQTPSSSPNVIV